MDQAFSLHSHQKPHAFHPTEPSKFPLWGSIKPSVPCFCTRGSENTKLLDSAGLLYYRMIVSGLSWTLRKKIISQTIIAYYFPNMCKMCQVLRYTLKVIKIYARLKIEALLRYLKWLRCINSYYLLFYHKDDGFLESLRSTSKKIDLNKSRGELSAPIEQHLSEHELKGGGTDFQCLSCSPSPSEAWGLQHSLYCLKLLAILSFQLEIHLASYSNLF